ncbi:unnamed protein product [Calicophoron daubneyi]|uniref:Uncharacterized protein n=1 Tax=Calicophoron daubneyi TaxID=300641 RepID=A0AAV2T556_CALDB
MDFSESNFVRNRRPQTFTEVTQLLKEDQGPKRKYVSYVNRVPFARRKKSDGWLVVGIEVLVVLTAFTLAILAYVYADELHLRITRAYAKMGVKRAQSILSERLLHDGKTQEERDEAIHWLEKAAKSGDPKANYNLVIAHMKKHSDKRAPITADEARRMMEHASNNGISEAQKFLQHCIGEICPHIERHFPKFV